MFKTIIGDDWDVVHYLFNGWNIVSKSPLIDGSYRYELKLE